MGTGAYPGASAQSKDKPWACTNAPLSQIHTLTHTLFFTFLLQKVLIYTVEPGFNKCNIVYSFSAVCNYVPAFIIISTKLNYTRIAMFQCVRVRERENLVCFFHCILNKVSSSSVCCRVLHRPKNKRTKKEIWWHSKGQNVRQVKSTWYRHGWLKCVAEWILCGKTL